MEEIKIQLEEDHLKSINQPTEKEERKIEKEPSLAEKLESLKPGDVIRARFRGMDLYCEHVVQEGEDKAKALAALTDTIFAARTGKPFPKHGKVVSGFDYNRGVLADKLSNYVSLEDGSIDCIIEVFPAE